MSEQATTVRRHYAWCFDHGTMHEFPYGKDPWCTALWTVLPANNAEDALKVKKARFGDAQFLNDIQPRELATILTLEHVVTIERKSNATLRAQVERARWIAVDLEQRLAEVERIAADYREMTLDGHVLRDACDEILAAVNADHGGDERG